MERGGGWGWGGEITKTPFSPPKPPRRADAGSPGREKPDAGGSSREAGGSAGAAGGFVLLGVSV